MSNVTSRERTTILQSLVAGVVPSLGLHHIQVGRKEEVSALLNDLEIVSQGGSSVRFVIGRFGSGKTFFLNLIRNVAHQKKFVVLQADITTDRRLHGTGGQARVLYSELMHNLSTRAKPDGGALSNVVERWVGDVRHEIVSGGGEQEDVKRHLEKQTQPLQDLVSGYDFVNVVTRYFEGYQAHNELLQNNAIRWLRAEYSTKTQAREDLGVRTIIDDGSFYDYLKLFAKFVRIAGYSGLLVNIDELVVLSHRLTNTIARNKNYESILRIINDSLQGHTEGLAFLFAGTDECLEDQRRGLYSYEALATRLAPNRFATDGRRDYASPVLQLESLSPEDCYVLLQNIRHVHAGGDEATYLIPDEGIVTYLSDCSYRMGAAYFQTPRDTVKDFVNLLNITEQDPAHDWQTILKQSAAGEDASLLDIAQRPSQSSTSSTLTEFRL